MAGSEIMFSHKKTTKTMMARWNGKSSNNSWNQCCCLLISVCCLLAHSAYGQLPSALTTKTTIATTTTTTTLAPPLVIVESIAVDDHKHNTVVVAHNDNDNDNVKKTASEAAATEILQLPHTFRHQQHYSHRIEQAVNDFKQQQQQQQLKESHLKERDKNNNNNKNKNDTRYEQSIQWHDQLQQQQTEHHQHRHEHHWLKQQQEEEKQNEEKQKHFRHHNHYYAAAWEQHNIPTLRHQHHRHVFTTLKPKTIIIKAKEVETEAEEEQEEEEAEDRRTEEQPIAVADNELDVHDDNEHLRLHLVHVSPLLANVTTTTTQRYFDRDSIFSAQHNKHAAAPTRTSTILAGNHSPSTRGPNNNNNKLRLQYGAAQRNTINFNDNILMDFVNELDDNNNNNNDDDDDFFEQNIEQINNFPTSRPSTVKRYSNPMKNIAKSFLATKSKYQHTSVNAENFNDEKLRMRVQQHHIRQQEHQRELEALREGHGGVGINKHYNNNNNNEASHLVIHLLLLIYYSFFFLYLY